MNKLFFLLFISILIPRALISQNSNKSHRADSLLTKSIDDLSNDKYSEAIINSNESLKLFQELNDKKGIAKSLYQLAECNSYLNNHKQSYFYTQQSLAEYNKLNDRKGIADCYELIGNYFEFFEQDIQKALDAYQTGVKFSEEANYKKRKAYLLGNIGRIHFKENSLTEALDYNFESLKLKEELNDVKGAGFSLHKIGQIYFKKGDIEKAKEFALKSMEIAERNNYLENLKRSAQLLNEIYKKQNKFQLANEMYELYIKSRDSLNDISLQKVALQKEMQYQFDKKRTTDSLIVADERKLNNLKFEQEKKQRWILYGVLALIALFAAFVFNRFKITQKQKLIIEQKEAETQKQKQIIEHKQKEITDSIIYAQRLQHAILPSTEFISKNTANNFIYYQPKDIVAGDFYWAEKIGDKFFIAAADSTGHGVPGAMVSVVCSNALNRTIKEFNLIETGKILDKTRTLVLETFEKSSDEVKDGMDISLICIDSNNKSITWSGANNPLWYIQDGELKEIKPDKQPIGKTDNPKPFTTHQIEYKEKSIFYLFTDGLADQFGGPNGKKFKYKQMSELLFKNANCSMKEQSALIENAFLTWRGDLEQVDDICIIGIKI